MEEKFDREQKAKEHRENLREERLRQRELEKLKRLPPYVFTEVNRIKDAARAKGSDIIDFGMGNPDIPTPKHIVDKLVETSQDTKMHRYSASRGITGLRKENV